MDSISAASKETNMSIASPNPSLKQSNQHSMSARYHDSEIQNNTKIVNTAIGLVIAGMIVLVGGIALAIFEKTTSGIVSSVAGILVNFISAYIFKLISISNESKQKYYNQLARGEEMERILLAIDTCKTEKSKEKMIEKIVDSFCKNSIN